jgi:hypothetical protein
MQNTASPSYLSGRGGHIRSSQIHLSWLFYVLTDGNGTVKIINA